MAKLFSEEQLNRAQKIFWKKFILLIINLKIIPSPNK